MCRTGVYPNNNIFTVQQGQFGHKNRAQTYGFPLNAPPSGSGARLTKKGAIYRNNTIGHRSNAAMQYNNKLYSNNCSVI